MQNKPQLSAEMEKRFKNCDGYQCDSCYGTGKDQKLAIDNGIDIDCQKCGGSGVTELAREVRNFLATALEEQKKEILSEVYDLMNESDGVAGLHLNGEVATWDWLLDHGWLPTVAKLNQLKGTE